MQSSLWNYFSKALIRESLEDENKKRYEIRCSQVPAGCSGHCEGTYILDLSRSKNLEQIFDYAARKMLRGLDCSFPEIEIIKLRRFLLHDYTTREHFLESEKIGLEADSVFFP